MRLCINPRFLRIKILTVIYFILFTVDGSLRSIQILQIIAEKVVERKTLLICRSKFIKLLAFSEPFLFLVQLKILKMCSEYMITKLRNFRIVIDKAITQNFAREWLHRNG